MYGFACEKKMDLFGLPGGGGVVVVAVRCGMGRDSFLAKTL